MSYGRKKYMERSVVYGEEVHARSGFFHLPLFIFSVLLLVWAINFTHTLSKTSIAITVFFVLVTLILTVAEPRYIANGMCRFKNMCRTAPFLTFPDNL